ncbi:MAG: PDGLE domain-containing protein [Methanocorpusculum sp.]|nr:PDGLE domain-containing protein [Methanocorpusculum sp.]
MIAVVIGVGAVFFASSNPDGLDSTFLVNEGQKEIFAPATGDEVAGEANNPINWSAPMPDYALGDSPIGAIAALIIGIFAALAIILVAAKLVHKKSEADKK